MRMRILPHTYEYGSSEVCAYCWVKTALEMEIHEEKLHNMIRQSKKRGVCVCMMPPYVCVCYLIRMRILLKVAQYDPAEQDE